MLGLGAIPAAAFLLAMRRAPESPRFLIQVGRTDEGFAVLEHILGTERARLRTDDIQASVKLETEMSHEFHDLFRPGLRRALVIGIFLAVFNQFIGMNAISYYGPVMFSDLGFAGGHSVPRGRQRRRRGAGGHRGRHVPDRHVRP